MASTGPPMRAYLDYNASAPVRPEVRARVESLVFGSAFGNASSIHWAGREARRHLEAARVSVAGAFGRRPHEVIFTSGGSEADNLALFGALLHEAVHAPRLLVSAVEHPAVLGPARRLAALGVDVETIPVDGEGRLDLDALDRALLVPTTLVSVMAVNNETGVCMASREVIRRAHDRGARVFVDAVQAAGRTDIPAEADLIALSGHKLGGLKGGGALIIRESCALRPAIVGGPQERGHRAGTEDVAASLGLAVALTAALASQREESARLGALGARVEALLGSLEGVRIAGGGAPRVAGTTLGLFEGVDGDALLHALDLEGIAASSGSACSSGSLEPSHVLTAMGIAPHEALASVRFSLGWATTAGDIDRLEEVLPRVLEQVRSR